MDQGVAIGFEDRLAEIESRPRRAFVARSGVAVGLDVAAETMAWAWEHRVELDAMTNPLGYLYRVGQGRSRRHFR